MGKIIAQISTATGTDTCAYSKRDKASGMAGANCPISTPATMARATQSERKRSNSPIPSDLLGACESSDAVMYDSLYDSSNWAGQAISEDVSGSQTCGWPAQQSLTRNWIVSCTRFKFAR